MLERVLHKLPGLLTTQESQDRKRQELENAVENLRFLEDRVLSDQQVKDTLATCTSGIVVLSPGDPPLVIASRDRKYGRITLYPDKSLAKSGQLGLFIDFSRFGGFMEIDEMFLKSAQDSHGLLDICLPDNGVVHRLGGLKKEEIIEKVRAKTRVLLEALEIT